VVDWPLTPFSVEARPYARRARRGPVALRCQRRR
jgi:hypothetical protein